MPVYEYEARSLSGELVKGKLEALNRDVVSNSLMEKKLFPTKIHEFKNSSLNMDLSMMKKVPIKDIAVFARQFSVTLMAGINILRAIKIIGEQTENKRLRGILLEVQNDVEKGIALSEAMRKHKDFPEMLVNMISVGEASGTLDSVLDRMAVYYEKEYKLQQKVKQATTYPKIVAVFGLLVVLLLVAKIVPMFVKMIPEGKPIPVPTIIVLGASNFLTGYWFVLIPVVIAIIVAYKQYAKTVEGRYKIDYIKINFPKVGKVMKKIVVARFARTFGTLLSSGVPVLQAVSICAVITGNKVVEEVLMGSVEEIKCGKTLSECLEKRGDIFPPMIVQMVSIGEESGTLDQILDKTAEFYDGEVETATAQMTAMIEPIMIITLAAIVGFIILSVMLPMMSSYDSAA